LAAAHTVLEQLGLRSCWDTTPDGGREKYAVPATPHSHRRRFTALRAPRPPQAKGEEPRWTLALSTQPLAPAMLP